MIASAKLCPESIRHSLALYIEHGCDTGSFLAAVLENNLVRAVQCADENTLAALPHIVAYLYHEVRGDCWGSPEKRRAWIASRFKFESLKSDTEAELASVV